MLDLLDTENNACRIVAGLTLDQFNASYQLMASQAVQTNRWTQIALRQSVAEAALQIFIDGDLATQNYTDEMLSLNMSAADVCFFGGS